ncbi:MAG: relaxase domain-containing protein [Pseudolabrys sp.]|nr:relaxase domain-containing protein [Pseudolabrys sp.]
MVVTWNPAASSSYYIRQAEYYLGGEEPPGIWYAPAGDLGLTDGSTVERKTFERLYDAIGADGRPLLDKVRRHQNRTPAFDFTLSAPRSVSLAWAFASYDTKPLIEDAQYRAARATFAMLEREAAWARRGRNGVYIEHVPLSVALFRHGESRPAEHSDARTFGDPNLHTHGVVLNIATRPTDVTIGGLHSKILRDFKLAAGATYHAALAHELEKIGFAIDRVGKNGIFEIAGVDERTIDYFSARRQEIDAELGEHGVTSAQATALAAAIAKATRGSKRPDQTKHREEIWAEAARSLGIDVENFTERLWTNTRILDRVAAEQLLSTRLQALPAALTENESVIERRELIRAITATLVGTGLPSERAAGEVDRLLRSGAVIEIGRDALGLPAYSTPEMLAIEREVVANSQALAGCTWLSLDPEYLASACRSAGLTPEQTDAVGAAAKGSALVIIEGAPGVGKTTTLEPLVEAYREAGYRVIATATAWRIAKLLADDLGVESRATASWLAMLNAGQQVLDHRTVLIADEAGLLSARDMHTLLGAVQETGAKLILVGDREQLQAIGAGPGLDLVARAVEAARIQSIVRQREPWAREAITDFGTGRAATALDAFAKRGLLIEAEGAKAALNAIVGEAAKIGKQNPRGSVLILAKSNAAVAAISRAVREQRKAAGQIAGKEISFTAATPSGHATEIRLARGDRIRFLARDDELGVINGTVATVTRVSERHALRQKSPPLRIEADVNGRRIAFDPLQLADAQGRPRLGWAYASTIYGSQGFTVDHAVVYLDPSLNRHDIYVAASRAREHTTLVVDRKAIDRRLTTELPLDRQHGDLVFTDAERRSWLAERLARASVKTAALDLAAGSPAQQLTVREIRERRHRELSHEL